MGYDWLEEVKRKTHQGSRCGTEKKKRYSWVWDHMVENYGPIFDWAPAKGSHTHFLFPYFTSKLFCSVCIRSLVCLCTLSNWLFELTFVLEYSFLFLVFDLVSVSFKFSFFSLEIFDLSPKVVINVLLPVSSFFFHPNILPHFPLSSYLHLSYILICISSLVTHPGFELLFVLPRWTPILSQTNFTPA